MGKREFSMAYIEEILLPTTGRRKPKPLPGGWRDHPEAVARVAEVFEEYGDLTIEANISFALRQYYKQTGWKKLEEAALAMYRKGLVFFPSVTPHDYGLHFFYFDRHSTAFRLAWTLPWVQHTHTRPCLEVNEMVSSAFYHYMCWRGFPDLALQLYDDLEEQGAVIRLKRARAMVEMVEEGTYPETADSDTLEIVTAYLRAINEKPTSLMYAALLMPDDFYPVLREVIKQWVLHGRRDPLSYEVTLCTIDS